MSFRGGRFQNRGGGGRNFGGGGFRGGRGNNRGGGRGGFNKFQSDEPPQEVIPFAHFTHPCQNDLVLKVDMDDVPFFNAPVYLQNKQSIGKVDEIFGGLHDYFVSVKLSSDLKASSFNVNDEFYIDPAKILPLKRFLPAPPGQKNQPKRPGGSNRGSRGRGGGRGGGGGRGDGNRFSRGGGSDRRGGGGDRRGFGGGRFSGGGRGRSSFNRR